jgi:hypothetical protein
VDTGELEQACRHVVATASRLDQRDAGSDRDWAPSQVLAHLIAANRNMTELVARVMAGAKAAPFTNQAALQRPYLDAIVRGAGDREGLIADFERSSRELIDTSAALDDDADQAVIDTAFWEAEGIVFEGPMPLAQLFTVIRGHIEGHVEQLAAVTRGRGT